MRERINPRAGARNRSFGVTVSWRKTSERANAVLIVTIGGEVVKQLGLERGQRIVVERDRLAGRLYLRADPHEGWKPSWKEGCACVNIPLDDVTSEKRPAQGVAWEIVSGELSLRLPTWACPPVKIDTTKRAA